MENPYTNPERGMLTDGLHVGWEEGYVAGKAESDETKDDLIQALDENVDEAHRLLAEQAEIVSELVEAITATLTSWDITNGDGISDEALALMEQAIAKAKGD